ncbi:transposase IS204 [Petrotoga olearia DSM 13574]|uniref:Transposase IS204 n=2 Tax=Petrotoga olearia TaxID=156203 RepID=A0A2K1NZZ7_9BACT|nr:transposase IS204 [Petrotoga olearia DSM 13574]
MIFISSAITNSSCNNFNFRGKNSQKILQCIRYCSKKQNHLFQKIDKFMNGLKGLYKQLETLYIERLAEGSVNKLKVINWILYGRNKFKMLRQKVLFLENNGEI